MAIPFVFIRNDDVAVKSQSFMRFHRLARKYSIPVVYGVIPALLEDDLAVFLHREIKRHLGLFDLVQHGFCHKNYALPLAAKYEFGSGRTYDEQYQDIVCGLEIMRARFGDLFVPAFIPPFHGFDSNTLNIINSLGIPLFSAGNKVSVRHKSFLDCPALFALDQYADKSQSDCMDPTKMLLQIQYAISVSGFSGFLFHHQALDNKANLKSLELCFQLLAKLRIDRTIRMGLLSELLLSQSRVGTNSFH